MNNTTKIIQYILEELSPLERRRFEELLGKEPELQKEVEAVRAALELARQNLEARTPEEKEQLIADIQAEEHIRNFEDRQPSEQEAAFRKALTAAMDRSKTPRKNTRNLGRWFSVALLAAASLLFFVIPKSSMSSLVDRYYAPAAENGILEQVEITRNNMNPGVQFYLNADYSAAMDWFLMHDSSSDPDWIRFFYALTWYELDQPDRSLSVLDDLIANGDGTFAVHANWYTVLILAKEGRREEALKHLENFNWKDSPYRRESSKLTRSLRKEL